MAISEMLMTLNDKAIALNLRRTDNTRKKKKKDTLTTNYLHNNIQTTKMFERVSSSCSIGGTRRYALVKSDHKS
jgi:hypothetical protein